MIHEPLLREECLDIPNGRLADHRSDLGPLAIAPSERPSAQPAFPIRWILAEVYVSILSVIQSPDIPRHCPLHRVADVVHIERIPVRPTMQVSDGVEITTK